MTREQFYLPRLSNHPICENENEGRENHPLRAASGDSLRALLLWLKSLSDCATVDALSASRGVTTFAMSGE